METVGSHNANSRLSKEAELLKAGWPTGFFFEGGCNEERMLCFCYLEQKTSKFPSFFYLSIIRDCKWHLKPQMGF